MFKFRIIEISKFAIPTQKLLTFNEEMQIKKFYLNKKLELKSINLSPIKKLELALLKFVQI
jgi:hypothetical protein